MATINVEVNGRSYAVGCEDGQEEHVRNLARQGGSQRREWDLVPVILIGRRLSRDPDRRRLRVGRTSDGDRLDLLRGRRGHGLRFGGLRHEDGCGFRAGRRIVPEVGEHGRAVAASEGRRSAVEAQRRQEFLVVAAAR